MKLLLITQKIDKDDDILGVYHEWAREIAKSFDKLTVFCLYRGKNELPDDIKVFSLGKDRFMIYDLRFKIFLKLRYFLNFFKYILRERKNYDSVLVHMNPIYVLLGWPVWKIMRKKIYLWYAHPGWNLWVKLAYILSDKVITSVPEAFHARGKKVKAIGQGIDVERFKIYDLRFKNKDSILFLGRISPSKNIHILIEALAKLKQKGVQFSFNMVGSPPDMPGAKEYDEKIRGMILDLDLAKETAIYRSVPYAETVDWYNKSDIFVNLSPTGHFDKTVLEAMASGCITLASNDAYFEVFPKDLHEFLIFRHGDTGDLAFKLKKVLELPEEKKEEIRRRLREIVVRDHSIHTLGERIYKAISYKH